MIRSWLDFVHNYCTFLLVEKSPAYRLKPNFIVGYAFCTVSVFMRI